MSEIDIKSWAKFYNGDMRHSMHEAFKAGVAYGRANPLNPGPETSKIRTKSEVLAARKKRGAGCCERYANMQGCECFSEAIDDLEPGPELSKFRPGDVVQLKSGGFPMVIAEIIELTGNVIANWMTQTGETFQGKFPPAILMADCTSTEAVKEIQIHEKERFKSALVKALQKIRVDTAGRFGDSGRWSMTDLAADLAPVLADELGITLTEI